MKYLKSLNCFSFIKNIFSTNNITDENNAISIKGHNIQLEWINDIKRKNKMRFYK